MVDIGCEEPKVEPSMAKQKLKAIRGQKDELRANLLKLSDACPFHPSNPEDCPLFPLRKAEPRKRLEWLNALSESDLAYLATYHRVCLRIKVESGPAKRVVKSRAAKAAKDAIPGTK